MKISAFFQDVLGANLANDRWSWGAVNPVTDQVFLRVWHDQIQHSGSEEWVQLLRKPPRDPSNPTLGYRERQRQIDQIRNGAKGFGVVCVAVDPQVYYKRNIKSFDSDTLVELGEVREKATRIDARIVDRIPISELKRPRTSQSTLAIDVREILRSKGLGPTEKETLVSARIGQGWFRTAVLKLWNNQCSVTSATTIDAIRASHIKPWRASEPAERLDPHNGIPLVATLDALFDVGLISFSRSGELLVSSRLSESERKLFALAGKRLSRAPSPNSYKYLDHHRTQIFRH
jgi:putative restriction endonuclease